MKEKIINSAYGIFLDKGYVETTVSEISRDAGVAYGTVYFYFRKGKDDVLTKIFKMVMDEFYNIIEQEYKIEKVEDVQEITYEQLMSSFRIVDKNRRIIQVIWEAKGKSELIYSNIINLKEKFIYRISEDIQYNRRKGFTKTANDLLVARAFMHMIWGFIWEYAFSDKYEANDIAEIVSSIYYKGVFYHNNN